MTASSARILSIPIVLLVGLLHAPRADAQCEALARQLIGADLGGPRIYAPTLTATIGGTPDPAVSAGIDTLVGSGPGLPNETARVHWYRDRIVSVFIQWVPKTDDEWKASTAKLAALIGTPRLGEINGGPTKLACGERIDATATRTRTSRGGAVDRAPLELTLVDRQGDAAMKKDLDAGKTKR